MKTINRSAVLVKPAQPFLDWLRSVDPASTNLKLEDLRQEPSIYLLPEFDNNEDALKFLPKVCKQIFKEQLESWWTEPSDWPADQGIAALKQWFEFSFHSMIFDLSREPLKHDD
jgi:hypothetical protein